MSFEPSVELFTLSVGHLDLFGVGCDAVPHVLDEKVKRSTLYEMTSSGA